MTHLDRFSDWVAAHRAELEQAGSVRFNRGVEDVPNPSASLVVGFADSEVELLLWTTGEGEFNHGPVNDPTFEHVEVESSEELDALLGRVLEAVTSSGP
jgi:hypothetical protein